MTSRAIERIRFHSKPLAPQPTELKPSVQKLSQIRAVLFDIYGTLLISASGDIGLDSGAHRAAALLDVTQEFGWSLKCTGEEGIRSFEQTIRHDHAEAKAKGTEYPEIEIRDVWRRVLQKIAGEATPSDELGSTDYASFALEFELRINPVWPMPGVSQVLSSLQNAGLVMGIVSNAQFFTPLLFPALLDRTLPEWGVAQELSYYSYEHRQAKPGKILYEMAAQALSAKGILPEQVLYVGNDMLNDMAPAQQVGFRTALFAGDRRSLRLRSGDHRVHGVEADIVVTELPQLLECLPLHS